MAIYFVVIAILVTAGCGKEDSGSEGDQATGKSGTVQDQNTSSTVKTGGPSGYWNECR